MDDQPGKRVMEVTKLGAFESGDTFLQNCIEYIDEDSLELPQNIRKRREKVGVKFPSVEVRYKNLNVEAECTVVHGKPIPTLWNSAKSALSIFAKIWDSRSRMAKIRILKDVSGIIKPGRMTLLLGPPGCGKTTLLRALSRNLNQSLKVTGEISYNGHKPEECVPQKTSVYISQDDIHIPEMTVRETLAFSARCQGVGSLAEILLEVSRRENEAEIFPGVHTFKKAISANKLERTLQTDCILRILGLDTCADTMVGSANRRGISGGQKKRLTTGEMLVGSTNTLFMDEITNGLDSSTAFQIVSCIQQLAHISNVTVLVSLLQPAPEAFDLFDDIILMAEGKIIYHGPRENVPAFLENCGFKCPERKAFAEFLHEVISKKDQEQYWYHTELPYSYFTADMFSRQFKETRLAKKLDKELAEPYYKSETHQSAVSYNVNSVSKWELFKACMSREFLLMKRNSFIHVFKTIQLIVVAIVTMTTFLRTQMDIDVLHGNYYMGASFFALSALFFNAIPELSMTVARLPVFYKQKELHFYPSWIYVIVSAILKIPLSLMTSLIWTSLTYYAIGYSPEISRFFCQCILFFSFHFMSLSLFRLVASIFPTPVASSAVGNSAVFLLLLFSGFIIVKPSMPSWLKWGFWASPVSYGEIALSVNEFHAPRWQKLLDTNKSIGQEILESHGLNFEEHYFWIAIGALFGFALIFNLGYALALTFLKCPGSRHAIISKDKLSRKHQNEDASDQSNVEEKSRRSTSKSNKAMDLPFEPFTLTFENVQYYVESPLKMREGKFASKKVQLLSGVTGVFMPGVLTALMGVSGAGKTTLLDVLAGRKTSGYIEGNIKINGYPKAQETFARISGYCEQTDIHSPQITVEESLMFSAWLRLDPQINSKTKVEFVNKVIETIELEGIKDTLVGTPGVNGLSTEQRRRLTIAVELVANPSIMFMDEPTTSLNARAAAIVMRAIKNIADIGRTIACTIHQPSIDIFESFDELILIKPGGNVIYSGPLGQRSRTVIEYFEGISGVPKIQNNCNPATWMLVVTSESSEAELGVDFAKIYRNSPLYRDNMELMQKLSNPHPLSSDLHFPSRFSQNGWRQFKYCLWKQHLSYWRSPSYNLVRIGCTFLASLLFGLLYWRQGKKIDNQQDLFNILGSMYASIFFMGTINCNLVLPYVATERSVMYREKLAGMYSPWAYSLAQATIEIPYSFIQAVVFVLIVYPMTGYYLSAYKILWYLHSIFSSLLFFNYMGMLLVSLTPNVTLAVTLSSVFFTTFNLFSGFLIPQPHITKWWIWLYYLTPTSWALNGLIASQYGDIEKYISVFEETKTVAVFLKDYYGFHYHQLPITAIVLIAFPLAYAHLFAFFIAKLNFHTR
ncbi:pleiotropic drug resistance protein 3-like [Tripterygium wilfordii]|uniref:pleiotropic drug resistance protein 3-like n=1 Tax=Tripterygium wilfordii TaxID=458696 RepID=UPI0018F82A5F|nr:pleiotropic drug resistance protein 3-like [Tripterygium wilfordii]